MIAAQGTTPRLDLLLRRLVVTAGDVRDFLASGDWEAALPAQEAFDEEFSMLQRLVETGHAFEQRHAATLAQLHAVHRENEQLARELRKTAGAELATVTNVRRVNTAYSPLGMNHRPSPRFVDGAA